MAIDAFFSDFFILPHPKIYITFPFTPDGRLLDVGVVIIKIMIAQSLPGSWHPFIPARLLFIYLYMRGHSRFHHV